MVAAVRVCIECIVEDDKRENSVSVDEVEGALLIIRAICETELAGTGGDLELPEIGGGRGDITGGERKPSGIGGPRELPGSGGQRELPGTGWLCEEPGMAGGERELPGTGGERELPGWGGLRELPGSGGTGGDLLPIDGKGRRPTDVCVWAR